MKITICYLFFSLAFGILYLKASIKNTTDCSPFKLTIKVNNLDTGKIRIMYNNCNDSSIRYATSLNDGVATFTGFINRASEALVFIDLSSDRVDLDGPKVIRFILEAKPMNLSYSVNDLGAYDIMVSGSGSQTDYEAWKEVNRLNLTLIEAFYGKLSSNILAKEKELYKLKLDSVSQIIREKVKDYVSSHEESYTSAYLLKKYGSRMPIDTLKAYYSKLAEPAQQNEIGKGILDHILTLSGGDDIFIAKYGTKNLSKQLQKSKGFLDFKLLDLNNNSFELNNFKDRFTFVNFWASWCEPCIKNFPAFEKLKEQYKNKQINFLSISIDKNTASWKKSVLSNKLSGINLIDADGILKSFYGIQEVPIYMIIKPDGKVADANVSKPGSALLYNIIDKHLMKITKSD